MNIEQLYQLFLAHPEVTTDSRHCPAGSLFFALRGERFDGNDYAASALRQGCAYAVVDRPELADTDERMIVVDDTLRALQQLARHHRRTLGMPVIGITGTNGKTTTKELVAAVLSTTFRVLYTQGNLNNAIGVPLTLLRLREEHEMAVIEMGASHIGDIKELVDICEPDYGLITNVGRAHLQGFGSVEGVARTKGELYDYLREHGGTAFVNGQDTRLGKMCTGMRRIVYGQATGIMIASDPLLRVSLEGRIVHTQLVGAYNTPNVLAAAAIGKHFGVPTDSICQAIEGYTPTNNRSQLVQTQANLLIVDAYNANPTSMAVAIEEFEKLQKNYGVCILGDMKELGSISVHEHRKICLLLKKTKMDVWLVGEEFLKADTERRFRHFEHVEDVVSHLQDSPLTGATILIKGSNSLRLYILPQWL